MASALRPGARVHVMGAGGTGMSGLARLLAELGCVVSGCDAADSLTLRELAQAGVAVDVGHDASHVAGIDVLTASPAVPGDAPEVVAAQRAGVAVLARADVLAVLGELAPVVGFAGTHGKTTATSMAVCAFLADGRDPGWLLGAPVTGVGPSGRWRDGAELIVELDESYGAFQTVTPDALGLLAVDDDHLDYYGSRAALDDAFASLVARTRGVVVGNGDQVGARAVLAASGRDAVTVGVAGCDATVSHLRFIGTGSSFDLATPFGACHVSLNVPGSLNAANAAVAATLALARGVAPDAVRSGLRRFRGAPRRFSVLGNYLGTTIVEDFAHLPEEVAATIQAAVESGFADIVAVFQPHRVTRTLARGAQFAGAFGGVRALIVTDLYSAGEPNPSGVTGELVADAVAEGPNAPVVTYAASLDLATEIAARHVGHCELLIVCGAGDVGAVAHNLTGRYA